MADQEHNYAGSELRYNALMEPSLRAAIHSIPVPQHQARVLDAGCGPGGVFPFWAERVGATGTILGIDGSEPHLVAAQQQIEQHGLQKIVQLQSADLTQDLPVLPVSFDVVWIADVIYPSDFDDPVALVQRLSTVLKPGGTLAIFYGNWLRPLFLPGYARLEHLICATKEFEYADSRSWDRAFHPEQAAAWMRKAGLEEVHVEVFPSRHEQPLPPNVRTYLAHHALPEYYGQPLKSHGHHVGITESDYNLWQQLTDPEGSSYILNQPDYYCVTCALLATGRKS